NVEACEDGPNRPSDRVGRRRARHCGTILPLFPAVFSASRASRQTFRVTGQFAFIARLCPTTQAKTRGQDMLGRVRGAQSTSPEPSPSHGENRGSSPLGSANQINCLYRIGQLALFPSPIFLQINSGTRGTSLLRFSCLRFPMRSKPLHSEGRGREFESRRARQYDQSLNKQLHSTGRALAST